MDELHEAHEQAKKRVNDYLREFGGRTRTCRTLRLEKVNAEYLAACADFDDGSQNYLINMLLSSARESGFKSIIELSLEIRGGMHGN